MEKSRKNDSQLKEKVNRDFLLMTPEALDALHEMMTDNNINPLARVQAIALILDRGLGKAEESIRIQTNQTSMAEAQERLQPQTGYIAQSGTMKVVTNDDGTKTVIMENLKLKNVEHDNEFFFPVIDGSLQYHGYMYELSL